MASSKIQAFLGASRIAVVGASADRAKFGNKVCGPQGIGWCGFVVIGIEL